MHSAQHTQVSYGEDVKAWRVAVSPTDLQQARACPRPRRTWLAHVTQHKQLLSDWAFPRMPS